MIRAIVGANWGDEGKGKLTDVLAEHSDLVVRFQGGANAGHTIINQYGKFALHLMPSGIFHPEVTNVIGPGVALDPIAFLNELDSVLSRDIPHPKLCISDRAQVLMDFHVLLDTLEEERLGKRKFGSTKSGIAPFYSDKFAKVGIQVCQMLDRDLLHDRLVNSLEKKNILLEHLYHHPKLDADELTEKYYALGQRLKPWVQDTTELMHEAVKSGKRILLEGQLGALRDPDHGIYPYTTSSSPLAGYGSVGAGVPPWAITQVIAVTKAYSSSVGTGVFPSCITGEEAEELRKRGGDAGEYGAKTGRPRDVGWFDVVATRHGCITQGATDVAMTNLDVLSYLDEIPVCVAYELEGQRIHHFPATPSLQKVKPVYEVMKGWKTDIKGETDYNCLPQACRDYVERIEKMLGTPITILSTGPHREEICYREVAK